MTLVRSPKNRRSFFEQSMLNNFPSSTRARRHKYSVASQFCHPFGQAIAEMAIEQERVLHNMFPASTDREDVDLVYQTGTQYIDPTVSAILSGGSTISVAQTKANIDSFWKETVPTRLSLERKASRRIYAEKAASTFINDYTKVSYDLLEQKKFSLVDSSLVGSFIVSDPSVIPVHNVSGGLFDKPYQLVSFTSLARTVDSFRQESVAQTSYSISLSIAIKSTTSNASSVKLKVGIKNVGETVKVVTPSEELTTYLVTYTPPPGSLDVLYYEVEVTKDLQAASLEVYDLSLFEFNKVNQDATAKRSLSLLKDQEPNWAYVTVRNGNHFFDSSTATDRSLIPATVTIKGLSHLSKLTTERVLVPFNGTHRSLKTWKHIDEVIVDSMKPDAALVSVQLQNYQALSGQQDFLDSLTLPDFEGPLFYGMTSGGGVSDLTFDSFSHEEPALLIDGRDALETRMYSRLVEDDLSDVEFIDFKIDTLKKIGYFLSSDKRIFVYDLQLAWPSSTSLKRMEEERTYSPDLIMQELSSLDSYLKVGESISLIPEWRNKTDYLTKYRWLAVRPDGTKVGIDLGGAEVSLLTDFWIENTLTDIDEYGDFKFNPGSINYSPSTYGEHVLILESVFLNEEVTEYIHNRDVDIVIVDRKTPLVVLDLPTVDIRTPLGIDILPTGELSVAYANPEDDTLLDEEIFCLRYDYFFEDTETRTLYFREKYGTLIIVEGGNGVTLIRRKIVIVDNVDVSLTLEQIDNALIIVKADINPVALTFPAISTLTEDGLTTRIKHLGANLLTVNQTAPTTIEGLALFTSAMPGFWYEMVYSYAENAFFTMAGPGV